jgi:hypothetical protein
VHPDLAPRAEFLKGGTYDPRYGEYRGADLHRNQHHICPRYAVGYQPTLVGAAGDLRRTVVGIEGTVGQGLDSFQLAQRSESCSHLGTEEFRLFPRCEVTPLSRWTKLFLFLCINGLQALPPGV